MIAKTEADIYLAQLDAEFFGNQSLLYKDAKAPARAKEGEVKYLTNYLKFLQEKCEKLAS